MDNTLISEWGPQMRAVAVLLDHGFLLIDKQYTTIETYYQCENMANGRQSLGKPLPGVRYKLPWAYLGQSGDEYYFAVTPYCNEHSVLAYELVGVDLVRGSVRRYWSITEGDFDGIRAALGPEEHIV